MADQEQENRPQEGSAPPKQAPFKPIPTPAAPGGAPITPIKPVLRRPGEPKAEAEAPAAESTAEAADVTTARKTTRLELPPEVTPEAGADDEFRTVKLRPTAPPQPGSSPLPSGPKPATPAQVQAAKSKTTRITLESAFAASEGGEAPKTIRLKRPSELTKTATVAIGGGAASKTGAMPPLQRSATARLPTQKIEGLPGVDDAADSPTRRKTIKIKRPSAAPGVKITVGGKRMVKARPGAPTEEGDGEMLPLVDGKLPAGEVGPDKAHVTFVISAVAALIVTLGVAWILAAQAFGPNAAVTGYTTPWGADIAPPPGFVVID